MWYVYLYPYISQYCCTRSGSIIWYPKCQWNKCWGIWMESIELYGYFWVTSTFSDIRHLKFLFLLFKSYLNYDEIWHGTRFTNGFFARNSNTMETSPCHNSVAGHQISTFFCTCHDSTNVVPSTNFRSDHGIRVEVRVKRNFHRIWIAMEKPLVKRGPGPFVHLVPVCRMSTMRRFDVLFEVQRSKDNAVRRIWRCSNLAVPPYWISHSRRPDTIKPHPDLWCIWPRPVLHLGDKNYTAHAQNHILPTNCSEGETLSLFEKLTFSYCALWNIKSYGTAIHREYITKFSYCISSWSRGANMPQ